VGRQAEKQDGATPDDVSSRPYFKTRRFFRAWSRPSRARNKLGAGPETSKQIPSLVRLLDSDRECDFLPLQEPQSLVPGWNRSAAKFPTPDARLPIAQAKAL